MTRPRTYLPPADDQEAEDFLVQCGELQRISVETLTTGLRREMASLEASVWHVGHKTLHVRIPCIEPISATMRILDMVRQQDADMRIDGYGVSKRGCLLDFQVDLTHATTEGGYRCKL